MIRLTCEEDLVRIWSGGPWKFENQILMLTKWKPNFDPEIQRISHAMENINRQNNNREAGTSGDKDSQGVPIPIPISIGTGDTLPENVVDLEAGDAQTQEARTDHDDAIAQVGVA
ncbi:hypothetical protein IFM89_002034 [Coptis chinensis]|uniref:DUF4283 domain-containing protein n=1 Tax=Coptis chinensis TaxID=261450 RepID=A0A835LD45_9MAGN|nr:hypothetical protein IFM89_002034 [Coptis chinensis]